MNIPSVICTDEAYGGLESSLALISDRHCKRAYLDKLVPREILVQVFQAAANAPSSKNSQPWEVAVLMGASRNTLSAKLCKNFDERVIPNPDYQNRPQQMPQRWVERISKYGKAMFDHKGIARNDEIARRSHRRENFVFFGAPVELIFHVPANAVAGTFLDLGLFMQNVILGLNLQGIATCPQFSVASYSDTVREHLGLGKERIIVSGMAVGYADEDAAINTFVPERAPLEEFVRWLD